MRWFRMYAEAVDDAKLRLLAFEDRWHYVALLCCKAEGILDESAALLRRKVAVKLGLDMSALDEVMRRLAEVGLVDASTLQPIAWKKRQFVSDQDPTAALRQKAWRERNALRNGRVTRTETEADTDTDTEETERDAPAKRGTRLLLADMPGEWGDFCRKERPDLSPAAVFAIFRDHWTAKTGKDATRLDWLATWRNWVRRERAAPRAAPAGHKYADVIAGLTGRRGPTREVDMGEVVDVTARLVG